MGCTAFLAEPMLRPGESMGGPAGAGVGLQGGTALCLSGRKGTDSHVATRGGRGGHCEGWAGPTAFVGSTTETETDSHVGSCVTETGLLLLRHASFSSPYVTPSLLPGTIAPTLLVPARSGHEELSEMDALCQRCAVRLSTVHV